METWVHVEVWMVRCARGPCHDILPKIRMNLSILVATHDEAPTSYIIEDQIIKFCMESFKRLGLLPLTEQTRWANRCNLGFLEWINNVKFMIIQKRRPKFPFSTWMVKPWFGGRTLWRWNVLRKSSSTRNNSRSISKTSIFHPSIMRTKGRNCMSRNWDISPWRNMLISWWGCWGMWIISEREGWKLKASLEVYLSSTKKGSSLPTHRLLKRPFVWWHIVTRKEKENQRCNHHWK